jgi:hypothetical protein
MANMKFKAKAYGAAGAARRLASSSQWLDQELDRTIENLGSDAEIIFAAHALKKTGRMARGVRANFVGHMSEVTVEAVDPESGYDYVGVTRKGHRTLKIFPKKAEALRIPLAGGGVIFRSSVRGFHPVRDWAEMALPDVLRAADVAVSGLIQRIEARL